MDRLRIWQAREASQYEPSGATADTEYHRLTPRGEEDDDPLIVDGDAPRMRWSELQRRHPILPRRANLADLRGDEDSSNDEAWVAAQLEESAAWRRVDAQYVPFQASTTSLDDELTEEPDRSESRYVRSSGGLPPAKGRGRHDKGRGKGRRRAPPWTPPSPEPPSSAGWFPTWETSRNQHRCVPCQCAHGRSPRYRATHRYG